MLKKCPGLTCGINIVKSRFLFKTVDPWFYIMPISILTYTLKVHLDLASNSRIRGKTRSRGYPQTISSAFGVVFRKKYSNVDSFITFRAYM